MTDTSDAFKEEVLRMHGENREQLAGLAAEIRAMREAVHKETSEMKVNIAMLQVKCGIWGLVGGAIPALLVVLAKLLK